MQKLADYSAFFDACVSVVVVDALKIFGLNLVPCHVWVLVQPYRHIPHKIFHKNRVIMHHLFSRITCVFPDVWYIVVVKRIRR
mgnify:CR=1 FL=1